MSEVMHSKLYKRNRELEAEVESLRLQLQQQPRRNPGGDDGTVGAVHTTEMLFISPRSHSPVTEQPGSFTAPMHAPVTTPVRSSGTAASASGAANARRSDARGVRGVRDDGDDSELLQGLLDGASLAASTDDLSALEAAHQLQLNNLQQQLMDKDAVIASLSHARASDRSGHASSEALSSLQARVTDLTRQLQVCLRACLLACLLACLPCGCPPSVLVLLPKRHASYSWPIRLLACVLACLLACLS